MVGPCTLANAHKYWCAVEITSPDKNFDQSNPNDTWGNCQLSCIDQNNTKSPFLLSHEFSKTLLSNLEFGFEDEEESLKGKVVEKRCNPLST